MKESFNLFISRLKDRNIDFTDHHYVGITDTSVEYEKQEEIRRTVRQWQTYRLQD